ncbi:helix-turn-helix domain-containing protein [Lactiplantibacillus plantarum]|uniref:helix-turn-helix domain-containing protein n=1 Tax=Lactiplantibacillus plantarum TaxID=1590 RepID=UPI000A20300E|nr:helix-turn-helix transcriptional regulator [Lactiplantibacillus plantarum]ARO06075.1 transcriptional regulator [Lactiplantibacillus plantarum]QAS27627.1 XRE family transcriptional regulator [Lactiplantibacillus plantarum]RWZ43732.1 XRE family transcriptional regulator [Lactiplantibacillus plantarum]WNJ64075.1 helix-turn-helix transcriptional regulator [Lactiplantibacillus plantarum]
MLLAALLKTRRCQYGLTQAQLASKLFVTTQAVSKWERGKAIPSIDNLLALSDLYNLSLDELVRGSAFFPKPYIVGRRLSFGRLLGLGLFWLFVCLLFTGFGYQPWWLFLSLYIVGLIVVVPVGINSYWVIQPATIELHTYAASTLTKFRQIVFNCPQRLLIHYTDLQRVTISYRCRKRFSPFDFNPDYFRLILKTNAQTYQLECALKASDYLPQFVSYLQRQGVTVDDPQQVVELLVSGKSLYQHFHTET